MWERWWQTVQRRLSGSPSAEEEDPEWLLQQAQEEMRSLHAKNRERAVRAITQKNQLQQMVESTEEQVRALRAREETARVAGDIEKALHLGREASHQEATLELTRAHLEQASEAAELVKAAIKREEETIRRRTAHALALRAQWQLVKIEQAITVSLAQISTGSDVRLTHDQVQERHERNRAYVVEAVTQKNHLQQMVDGTAVTVANLREKADTARQRGDDVLECELLREMEQYEATLAQSREALDHAAAVTERAKSLVQEEAARVRALGEATPPPPAPTLIPQRPRMADETDDMLPILLTLTGIAFLLVIALLWWLMQAGR